MIGEPGDDQAEVIRAARGPTTAPSSMPRFGGRQDIARTISVNRPGRRIRLNVLSIATMPSAWNRFSLIVTHRRVDPMKAAISP